MRIVFAINGDPNVPIEQAAQLASARYRGLIPAREIARQQVHAEVVTVYDLFRPTFDPAGIDLLVLHQPKHDILVMESVIGLLMERLDAIRRNGGVVAIDVSDFKFSQSFHERMKQALGEQKAALYHMILNELFMRCSAVTTPTESLAGLLRQSLNRPVPIFVVDDVVEVARGEPRFAPGEPLNLLWFGLLTSHVAAVKQFVRTDLPQIARLRPTRLHILCEPVRTDDAVQFFGATLDALGISFGQWSVPALDAALAACDLVVLPVDTEGLVAKGKSNNRMLQALYAGRYAVAHPLDSFRQLGAFAGLDASLPAAIAAALDDPAAVLDRIRAGQAFVAQHYAPEAVARRWLDVCRQLTQKPAATAAG